MGPPRGENRRAGVVRLLLDIPWEETCPSDKNPWNTWGCGLDTSKDNLTQPAARAAAPRGAATSDNRRPPWEVDRHTQGIRCGKHGTDTGENPASQRSLKSSGHRKGAPPRWGGWDTYRGSAVHLHRLTGRCS